MEILGYTLDKPLRIWQVAKKLGIKKPKFPDFWGYLEQNEPIAWSQYTSTPTGTGGFISEYDELYQKFLKWLRDRKEEERQKVLKIIEKRIMLGELELLSEGKNNYNTTWAFRKFYSSNGFTSTKVYSMLKHIEEDERYYYNIRRDNRPSGKLINLLEQNNIVYKEGSDIKIDWEKAKSVWDDVN